MKTSSEDKNRYYLFIDFFNDKRKNDFIIHIKHRYIHHHPHI